MIRALMLIMTLGALGASLLVFEAASATRTALDMIDAARTGESPSLRARILMQAEAQIEQSWAQPQAWHAGAAEALSASALFRAEGDRLLWMKSRDWGLRTLRLAPAQPHTLVRLAALERLGVANPYCELVACLERSWALAPILRPEAECMRLELAHEAGALEHDDARLRNYLQVTSRRQAVRCFARFLPASETLALMLRAAAP